MSLSDLDLNAMLGSRICHDLASPLSAIGNTMELIEMSGAPQTPELALIADSIDHANARIRFFRIAFGHAAADQETGRGEIAAVLTPVFKARRIAVDWLPGGDIPRQEAKLTFLVLQCFDSAMPFGGQITVRRDGGRWAVIATADRMREMPELWGLLSDPAPGSDLKPADVHFVLAPITAQAMGRNLHMTSNDGSVTVSF